MLNGILNVGCSTQYFSTKFKIYFPNFALLLGNDENFALSRQRRKIDYYLYLSHPAGAGGRSSGVLEAPGVGAEVGAGWAGCSSPTGVVAVRRGRL